MPVILLFILLVAMVSDLHQLHNSVLIRSRQELDQVPSASGIEYLHEDLYVIGDNAPWLYKLNNAYELVDKYLLVNTGIDSGLVFSKKLKPDFEAIAKYNDQLLIFGSGSLSPHRNTMVSFDPDNPSGSKEYSLDMLYDHLISSGIVSKENLNIEGAAVLDNHLYLLNRGNNLVLKYNLTAFLQHLEGEDSIPLPEYSSVRLPAVNGVEAGLSGAAVIPGTHKLLFSASVEDTGNWVDDGEVLGSFIGILDLNNMEKQLEPECYPIKEDEELLKVKVESPVILNKKDKKIDVLLVTDNDEDESEAITVQLGRSLYGIK